MICALQYSASKATLAALRIRVKHPCITSEVFCQLRYPRVHQQAADRAEAILRLLCRLGMVYVRYNPRCDRPGPRPPVRYFCTTDHGYTVYAYFKKLRRATCGQLPIADGARWDRWTARVVKRARLRSRRTRPAAKPHRAAHS